MVGLVMRFQRWAERRRVLKYCLDHDRQRGFSYIREQIVDLGRRKLVWCQKCDKRWVI